VNVCHKDEAKSLFLVRPLLLFPYADPMKMTQMNNSACIVKMNRLREKEKCISVFLSAKAGMENLRSMVNGHFMYFASAASDKL
jgi:hypothetical protein